MSRAYYKSTAPEVLSALAEREEKVSEFRKAGNAFADHFGGKLIVRNGVTGYSIHGLSFDPEKPTRLWTVPDGTAMGAQRPRQSITKAKPEEKSELARIREEWKAHFPTGEVPFEPVLKAMGTSYGHLIFGGGFAMRQTGGAVYVTTSAKLNDHMVEILASEYQAAEKAADAEEAAARTNEMQP